MSLQNINLIIKLSSDHDYKLMHADYILMHVDYILMHADYKLMHADR